MSYGIVIFAHNSAEIDYALTAIIAGNLAKNQLNVPVTLITDSPTVEWLRQSNMHNVALSVFESIIETDKPVTNNKRQLFDGTTSSTVPFVNANRSDVWDLTPYDRTLLIDSDFLIFSNTLSNYWDVQESFMISPAMKDIIGNRVGVLDKHVSNEGIPLLWATTIMFTKDQYSKQFFDLVKHIKANYQTYGDIYRFDSRMYRNDIAFSIASHIIHGFSPSSQIYLPPILTAQGTDLIHSVHDNGLRLLVNDMQTNQFLICNVSNSDIHIMNKQAIVRSASQLLEIV